VRVRRGDRLDGVVDTADPAEPADRSAEVAPTTRSSTALLAAARRRAAPLSFPPSCPLLPLMVGGRISPPLLSPSVGEL
jgi:hypothetical protein